MPVAKVDALPVINQAIIERLTARYSTQAAFADALGVRAQTVTKWVSGENTPPPARWPQIEALLGYSHGHFARLAGLVPTDGGADNRAEIGAIVEQIDGVIRGLEQLKSFVAGQATSGVAERRQRRRAPR